MKVNNLKIYLIFFLNLLLYSTTGIFSKLASKEAFLSLNYIIFYSIIILILAIYAIVYQQLLKRMDLSVAISLKPMVIVFGALWGILLFGEKLSVANIFGILLILIGVLFVGDIHE